MSPARSSGSDAAGWSGEPAEPEEPPIRFTNNRKIDREPADGAAAGEGDTSPAKQAAQAAAQTNVAEGVPEDVPKADALLLEERTADLQRLQAEYANYRKRAERERIAAGDAAIARVAGDFLPVLDDLDRARAHGDLTGALKAVADKLDDVFAKLGLESFGQVGDPFDPAIHEAVLHDVSDDVSVPTATTVMRQGYKHRERLVRPAMVGVTDPASPSAEAELDDAAPDLVTGDDTLTDATANATQAESATQANDATQADNATQPQDPITDEDAAAGPGNDSSRS